MTLRIHVNSKGDIYSYTRLDLISLALDDPLTPLVMGNLAMLKLAEVGDTVADIGVKLTPSVFICCELSPGHNPTIEDILIFIKALS
jgi:hypothetical protein